MAGSSVPCRPSRGVCRVRGAHRSGGPAPPGHLHRSALSSAIERLKAVCMGSTAVPMFDGNHLGELPGIASRSVSAGTPCTQILKLRDVVRDDQIREFNLVIFQPARWDRGWMESCASFEHGEEATFSFFEQLGCMLIRMDVNMRWPEDRDHQPRQRGAARSRAVCLGPNLEPRPAWLARRDTAAPRWTLREACAWRYQCRAATTLCGTCRT